MTRALQSLRDRPSRHEGSTYLLVQLGSPEETEYYNSAEW